MTTISGTPGDIERLTVVAGGPGWVALDDGMGPDDPVLVSDDGRSWRRAVGDEVDEARRIFTESQSRQPATTPPGENWDFNWRYAWDDDRVVAMAYAWFDAMLWASPDAGTTWSRVDPDQPAFDGWPRPWQLAITQYENLTIVGGNGIWIGLLPN